MDFKKVSDQVLIENLSWHVRSERKATELVLWHINEVERRRLHVHLGFSSIPKYLIETFGYCESSAYRRWQAARLLQSLPEISEKLETGELNLSQLTKINSALSKSEEFKSASKGQNQKIQSENVHFEKARIEKAKEILSAVENKSGPQTDVIIAKELDLPIIQNESKKMQKDESSLYQLYFSKEERDMIESVQADLSHQLKDFSLHEYVMVLTKREMNRTQGLKNQRRDLKTKNAESKNSETKDAETKDVKSQNSKAKDSKAKNAKSSTPKSQEIKDKDQQSPQSKSQCGVSAPSKEFQCRAFSLGPDSQRDVSTQRQFSLKSTTPLPAAKTQQQERSRKLEVQKPEMQKANGNFKRQTQSKQVERELKQKAQYQCEYRNPVTGERCSEKHFLQIDHIWPLALGGTNDISNLRILCAAHNQMAVQEMGFRLNF